MSDTLHPKRKIPELRQWIPMDHKVLRPVDGERCFVFLSVYWEHEEPRDPLAAYVEIATWWTDRFEIDSCGVGVDCWRPIEDLLYTHRVALAVRPTAVKHCVLCDSILADDYDHMTCESCIAAGKLL